MGLICKEPRPHLFGRALIWPDSALAQEVSAIFGLYPSSLAKSTGFVSVAGKVSLVSLSEVVLFL